LIAAHTEVSGSLEYIESTQASVALNALFSIGENLLIRNNANLKSINLSVLELVAGTLKITDNPLINSVAFPRLARVGHSFVVSGNKSLFALNIPLMQTILGTDLVICKNGAVFKVPASIRKILTESTVERKCMIAQGGGGCSPTACN
jgi:hypothetical protein